ncbi:MAG: hypothetical protein L6Q80_13470 [Dehalococcoidia bacterium]|nr:hypothetical protein [Dehalococcoidia bacterium]
MNRLKSNQGGGVAGIIFVLSMVVISFLVPPPPGTDEPASESLKYLADNRSAMMIQASLSALPTFPLFLLVPVWRRFLDSRGESNGVFSSATSTGILLGWAIGVAVALMFGALAFLSESTLDEEAARNLSVVLTVGYGGAVVFWGSGALFAGLALVGEKDAARWAGWLGIVVALLSAISVFGWSNEGLTAPGQLMFVGYLSNMVFLLTASILLLRDR